MVERSKGNKDYLTKREIEALELFKKHGFQKDVAKEMNSSGANVSLTLKRAREKITKSKNTLIQAETKGYLRALGISHFTSEILDSLVNSDDKAICIMDKDYRILAINAGIEKLFGSDDFLGKKCHEAFLNEKRPRADCPMSIALRTKEMCNVQRTYPVKDGRESLLKITAIPIKNGRGQILFCLESFEQTAR